MFMFFLLLLFVLHFAMVLQNFTIKQYLQYNTVYYCAIIMIIIVLFEISYFQRKVYFFRDKNEKIAIITHASLAV